ncbi:hypothetical protein [Anaeromyxobacter paludicola]|uniref:Carboxypeptidase regulatory-like domain-containing protein n=1 Tax=Anaeromyxobacter paludicola TaxID=2918171 RepID=A0ABN6NCY9_9BACT|nr:hypothetical protein [Anaeromyxobacter paludicola]BDG10004.1 hypothetical protein AMPC_31170 [Anaeromyxobacter paludicola]
MSGRALRATLALAALAACTPENGPTMRPGEDCLRCHGGSPASGGGEEERATPWSLAGTVYAAPGADASAGIEGAAVQVTDANGFAFTLTSNLVGNFYSAETVAFPIRVCVARGGAVRCMESPSPHGACNACHALPPQGNAEGRIAAP